MERLGSQIHKSLFIKHIFPTLFADGWVVGQVLREACINDAVLRTKKFSLSKSNKVYMLVSFWIFYWQKYIFFFFFFKWKQKYSFGRLYNFAFWTKVTKTNQRVQPKEEWSIIVQGKVESLNLKSKTANLKCVGLIGLYE